MIKFYIPNNLNIDDHIKKYDPINIKHFKRIKLAYILDIMTSSMDQDLVDGYKNLNAIILKKRIDNYNEYLTYLVWSDVFKTDNTIIPGEKSRGYRFTEKYNTSVKEIDYQDFAFEKNLKNRNSSFKSIKGPKYLDKWFNEKLEISDEAFEINEEIYRIKSNNPQLLDSDHKTKKIKCPLKQRNFGFKSIGKIRNAEHKCSRDKTSKRYHTHLSRTPSILRNFIIYDGERLVNIDLKNSQPYFSTMLFNPIFWMNNTDLFSHNQTANNQNYNNKINKLINYEIIQNRYRNYKRKILINKYFIYITLRTIAVRTGNKGIQRYIDLVLSGELYEFIEQELIELDYHPKGRKEVKQIVFLILFSSNKKKSPQEKMFQDIFPEVYGVFTEIKKGEDEGYKDLSVLLQRMESYLFIDVICKRISKEFPEAPIFTCHDSIATTYKYEEDVKRIASEELKKATGNIPILKSEHWTPEEAYKVLGELKSRDLATKKLV